MNGKSIDQDVIQILQKQEVGPDEIDLFMTKIQTVLIKYNQVKSLISLFERMEDRLDPTSKWSNFTIAEICSFYGVSKATYYRKKKIFDLKGRDGLLPKKRGPKSSRLPGMIQARIEELRDRSLSAHTISCIISVETQRNLSQSTVQYFLKSIGKGRLKRNKKIIKPDYIRFEKDNPNDMWQIDNVGPFYKPGKLFAYNVIDDHSRFVLGSIVSSNQTSLNWRITLEKLVSRYGAPKEILHDNGSQFVDPKTNKLTKEFGKFLRKYGIRSRRSRPRHPQTTGKVERVQQTLQYGIRDLVFTNSVKELQEAFDSWREFYNKVRVHSTTKKTPYERFFGQEAAYFDKLSACQNYEHSLIKFSKE